MRLAVPPGLRSEDLGSAERIVQGDPEATEVVDVPGSDAQISRLGDRENQQVSQLDRSSSSSRFRLQGGATECRRAVERKDITVGRQELCKPIFQELSLLPCWESLDSGRELKDPNRRQLKEGKLAKPADHTGIRPWSRRFRDDVCVEQVVAHLCPVLFRAKGSAGTKSRRAGSKSLTPPPCRCFKASTRCKNAAPPDLRRCWSAVRRS